MNPGKLEVVKQEMARVSIDILGISELKWTGMGKFNSDDHYIYYCGQESLRRNGIATHSQQKSPKWSTWVQLLFAFSYCSWSSQGKNTEVVCHSLLQWATFCSDQSTMTRPSWVAPRAWVSFIELDKAVVLVWLDWLVFCEYGFSVFALWCPLATPIILLGFLLPWAWGISSRLLQQSAAIAPYLGRGVLNQLCHDNSFILSISPAK